MDFGRIISGNEELLKRSYEAFEAQAVDQDLRGDLPMAIRPTQRTIQEPMVVKGPGTLFGKQTRTLRFEPTDREGWWFDRIDHPECLPVKVSIRNVWTTGDVVSNIVLRSGPKQNYIRLVEHIISLKMGFDIDNLMIKIDSGDPPLFNVGSMPIVEALEKAGRRDYEHPLSYATVKEKVSFVSPEGKFLIFEPVDLARPALDIDCAIHFNNALGLQRIQFPLNYDHFRHGAHARTNSSASKKLYCQTVGKLFADVRNLGYTKDNVLIAGKFRYTNEPQLFHEGKSLEAVWHRAILDLLAAVALIDDGRLLGKISSYKAGHYLDCEAVKLLYQNDLVEEVQLPSVPLAASDPASVESEVFRKTV
jgi:UDP-3-O-acyl-N-acetylglucosamine deacetylase